MGNPSSDQGAPSFFDRHRGVLDAVVVFVSIAAIALSVVALRVSQEANLLVEQQLVFARRPLLVARSYFDEAGYQLIDIVNESGDKFAYDLNVEFVTFLEFSPASTPGTVGESRFGALVPVFGWFSGVQSSADTARSGRIATVHLGEHRRTEYVTMTGFTDWLAQANEVATAQNWPWYPMLPLSVLRVAYVDSVGEHVTLYFWGDMWELRPVSSEIGDILFNLHNTLLQGVVPYISLSASGYPGFEDLLQLLQSVTSSTSYREACSRIEGLGEHPFFCRTDL